MIFKDKMEFNAGVIMQDGIIIAECESGTMFSEYHVPDRFVYDFIGVPRKEEKQEEDER